MPFLSNYFHNIIVLGHWTILQGRLKSIINPTIVTNIALWSHLIVSSHTYSIKQRELSWSLKELTIRQGLPRFLFAIDLFARAAGQSAGQGEARPPFSAESRKLATDVPATRRPRRRDLTSAWAPFN